MNILLNKAAMRNPWSHTMFFILSDADTGASISMQVWGLNICKEVLFIWAVIRMYAWRSATSNS